MARNEVKLVPLSSDDKPKVLRKLHGRPYFEKILTRSSSPLPSHCPSAKPQRKLRLHDWFVHKHGDKFQRSVILRTESSTKAWPLTLEIRINSPTSAIVRFSGGWNAFVVSNCLLEGDSLVFALTTVMTEFEVYVFRSYTNNRNAAANAKAKVDLLHMDNQIAAANAKEKLKARAKEQMAVYVKERLDTTSTTFLKKLTTTDLAFGLGIPLGFMNFHGSRIHSEVMMQGLHEQSPVQSMRCCLIRGRPVR